MKSLESSEGTCHRDLRENPEKGPVCGTSWPLTRRPVRDADSSTHGGRVNNAGLSPTTASTKEHGFHFSDWLYRHGMRGREKIMHFGLKFDKTVRGG